MVKKRKDRNLKSQDGKWYVDFTAQGKRIRKFGGYTKEQARNTLAKIRIEKLDEKLGFKKPGSGDPIPFGQFAGDFLETYCKQNKKSWKGDELILEALKTHFKGETLQSIGPEMIERYKAKRRAEVSPATVNRGLACLRTMFNKAVEWGRLEKSPLQAVKKFKENNARERILTGLEAKSLIENAVPSIRPVLIVALNTGMRRNEILSLKWADVDFAWKFILIADSKSGKPRKIPMNSAVLEALRGLPRVAEFIFYNPETKTHCVIRPNPAGDSGPKWPLNPEESGHRFRINPATYWPGPECEATLDNSTVIGHHGSLRNERSTRCRERDYPCARSKKS